MNVPKGKKIVVSYVGMETQEVDAVSGKDLKITMRDDAQSLDEVVVLGYGSKARKDLTGSVGSISGAKLAAVPVASAAEALQGKIAGVQVTTIDGAPGAEINIRVRGGTSVTQSNQPLYIVDGFQATALNNLKNEWIAHFYLYLCSINNRVYSEIFFVHVCFCGIPQIIPSQNDLIISSFVHHKIKLLYGS